MSNTMVRPREHLLKIQRIPERMEERSRYVCLDRNERVEPFASQIMRDLREQLVAALLCSYPDPSPLYARLSRDLGYQENWLYVTSGSDAAIRMLFQTYLEPGDIVVQADPSYAMYGIYTQIAQALPGTVPYDADLRLDLVRLYQLLAKRPKILVLANPNQPTGSALPLAIIRDMVSRAAEVGTLVILDEAYYPFHVETAVGLVREFSNLVVTRSFSKAQGLAGLRLGYLVAAPDVVLQVQRIRGAHEVNAAAIAAGVYVLDHPELAERYIEEVEAGRRVLTAAAKRLGLMCPHCPTNFQLLRFPQGSNTENVIAALKRKGYLVKGGFTAPAIHDCLRVTLAPPKIMLGFVEALEAVMAKGDALR